MTSIFTSAPKFSNMRMILFFFEQLMMILRFSFSKMIQLPFTGSQKTMRSNKILRSAKLCVSVAAKTSHLLNILLPTQNFPRRPVFVSLEFRYPLILLGMSRCPVLPRSAINCWVSCCGKSKPKYSSYTLSFSSFANY